MATAPLTPESDLAVLGRRLRGRFAGLRRRVRWQLALEALAWTCGLLAVLGLLSLALDWWLELSKAVRVSFLVVSGVPIVVALRQLIVALRLPLSPIQLAGALDRARGNGTNGNGSGIPDAAAPRVASVLQLPDLAEGAAGYSQAMIDRAVRQNYAALAEMDFNARLNRRHLALSLAGLAIAIALPIVVAVLRPDAASLWARRWLTGSDQPWPRTTRLEIVGAEGGKLIVPRGEGAVLKVRVHDENAPTETVWMEMTTADGQRQTVTLSRFEEGDFRYDLPPLQQPLGVRLWGGDGRAGPLEVTPVDRPRIEALELASGHPWDEKEQVHHFTGEEGSLKLLPKTEVRLTLTANVPIAELRLVDTTSAPGVFRQVGERTFTVQWTHEQPVQMKIELVSAEAGLISHPRPLAVGLRIDRPPRVTLRHSGVRQRVTPQASIPLRLDGRDDFGVSWLKSRTWVESLAADEVAGADTSEDSADDAADESTKESNAETKSPPPAQESIADLFGPEDPATRTSVEVPHEIELSSLTLRPGDLVHNVGQVSDNCYTGPQVVQSRPLVFRIVAPEELFREILLRQQELRARFRKAADDAENLRDGLPAAVVAEEGARLLRSHRLVQREVWRVSRGLEETVTEMRLNRLGGPEAQELIGRNVLTPLRRLHDQTMTQQRQALEALSTADAESLDQLSDRQDVIVDEMDRILKSMTQWDSFIDVVNQLNAVIKLEDKIRLHTEKLRKIQEESAFDD